MICAVYDGKLLTYHPMGESAFVERLTSAASGAVSVWRVI